MSIIQSTSKGSGASYEIDQSIRFDKTTSSHLSKTYSSAGNRKTWTFSTWFKRGKIDGTRQSLFAAGGTAYLQVGPDAASREMITILNEGSGTDLNWYTTQVFRDPGAWYHLVWQFDSTQSTADNRTKLYINGSQITEFTKAATPAQNFDGAVNNAVEHRLGELHIANYYFDGYQAEINFIDGTALDPTSFGETNNDGVWIPKAYSGAYGTNGFYITGETASDLGEDFSGNNNDFTSAGLTTADQMLDTPTLNKATLNVLNLYSTGSALSDGNLTVTNSGTSGFWHRSYATQALSYKTYWEVHADNLGSLNMGVSSLGNVPGGVNNPAGNKAAGAQNNEAFVTGSYANEGSGGRTFPISTGNYVMLAFDPARGALWMGTEGTWKDGTGSSASSSTILAEIEGSGTSYAIFTGIDADDAIPMIAQYSTSVATARFSSGDWEGTVPTGYEELSTAFIATPTIADGSAYFQPTLYTGNGSALEVNQSGNSTFQPDWLWVKSRSLGSGGNHVSYDAVRGVTKEIYPNLTNVEGATNALTSFDANGFTLQGASSGSERFNKSGATYVGWQWKANGSGSSNTDGTITSTASANTTAGFSVVKYAGNLSATGSATIGHGLGIAPSVVISKSMDSTAGDSGAWAVQHTSLAASNILRLNTTAATSSKSGNGTLSSPTSTVFYTNYTEGLNVTGNDYIAYCFAEIPGYSSFGSYTGNGSATDGPFVYTGLKPKWIMYKSTTAGTRWGILDTDRSASGGGNSVGDQLFAELADAEANADHEIDFLSNGFKVRDASGSVNGNGYTITYMAFAENPFGGDGAAPATAR